MNHYLLSLLLGVIEGLTEFLPVSSTAHLRIAEAALGIDLSSGYWKMYSIVIQLGAILCLPLYFRARIAEFLHDFPRGRDGRHTAFTHPLTLTMIAFICTAVPSLLLTKIIGKHLESIHVMGLALVIGGIIMWIVDAAYGRPRRFVLARSAGAAGTGYKTENMADISLGQAVWIGFCQVFSAVFPGTSRSMSTIAAGQIVGMSRPAALEFSFFLSIPTMVAATAYDLFKSLHHKTGTSAIGIGPANAEEWVVLLIGFVVSFLVAYVVVAWFMNWVRHRGFTPFAIYRIVFGAAVLVWAMRAGLQ